MLTSVAGDSYAIGYVSLGSLNDSVKAVKIDGAEATVANINNGSYKISRPFNIAVKENVSGVTNAVNGTCDIGMVSRGLKDSEKAKGVKEITIAIDGIAVIVNKENPADNLTKAQVEQIFTGNVSKWSDVK